MPQRIGTSSLPTANHDRRKGAGATTRKKLETMNKVIARTILVTASTLVLAFAPLSPASATETGDVLTEAASLDPGEFVWEPSRASEGAVEVVVSIPLQRAYVYRGGTLIGITTVSTGRPGHETPTGTFEILQKRREHYSNRYNNAPMPFMQRLTWDGIALHAGQIPGRPASHGCVRLPLAFARHLFGVTQMGAAVHITDSSPGALEALAMVRGNGVYNGMGGPLEEVEAPAVAAPAVTAAASPAPAPAAPRFRVAGSARAGANSAAAAQTTGVTTSGVGIGGQ